MAKKHVITFDQAGNIKVDATGYVGKACAETTEKLLAGLGSQKTNEELKPEYNRIGVGASTSKVEQRW